MPDTQTHKKQAVTHSAFAPSSLERRALCPGSYNIEKDLPDTASEISLRGVEIHATIHDLINNVSPTQSDESIEIANKALSMVRVMYPNVSLQSEVHVEYKLPNNMTLYYGTADLILKDANGDFVLIDWKTGFLPTTNAQNNLQGKAYSLAIMQKYGVQKVTVHFINPVINQLSTAVFTNEKELLAEILQIIDTADKPTANCIPGDKQCRYCKGLIYGTCPAVRNLITANQAFPTLDKLSDEELTTLWEQIKNIKALESAICDEIRKRCEDNITCGGYKIITKAGMRKIDDPIEAYVKSAKIMSAVDFLQCCTVSVAKLEKSYADIVAKNTKTSKVKAKEIFNDVFDEIISRTQLSPSITKINQ